MISASHRALCIKVSLTSGLGLKSFVGAEGNRMGRAVVILGLAPPTGMLDISGPWASLRQAGSSGTMFVGGRAALSWGEI